MGEYFDRAEYIKKTVMPKAEEEIHTGGGSGQAAKKRYDKSEFNRSSNN